MGPSPRRKARTLTQQFSKAREDCGGAFSEEQLASLRDIFQQLDTDGNGTLELEDIQSYMDSVGWPVPQELREEFASFDRDGSGGLDVEEFLSLMSWAGSSQAAAAVGRSPPPPDAWSPPSVQRAAAEEEEEEEDEEEEDERCGASRRAEVLRHRVSQRDARIASLEQQAAASAEQARRLHQELERASEQLEEAASQQDVLRSQLAAQTAEFESAQRDLKEAHELRLERRDCEARDAAAQLVAMRAAFAKCEEEKHDLGIAADAGAQELDRLAHDCQALERALSRRELDLVLLLCFLCWREDASICRASREASSRATAEVRQEEAVLELWRRGSCPPNAIPMAASANTHLAEEADEALSMCSPQSRTSVAAQTAASELAALQAATRSLLPELAQLGALVERLAGAAATSPAPASAGEEEQSDASLCDEAALLRRECLRWQHLLSDASRERQGHAHYKASAVAGSPCCLEWLRRLWPSSA